MSHVVIRIRDVSNKEIDNIKSQYPNAEIISGQKSYTRREQRINFLANQLRKYPETRFERLYRLIRTQGYPHGRKTLERDIISLETRGLLNRNVIMGGRDGSYSLIKIIEADKDE